MVEGQEIERQMRKDKQYNHREGPEVNFKAAPGRCYINHTINGLTTLQMATCQTCKIFET